MATDSFSRSCSHDVYSGRSRRLEQVFDLKPTTSTHTHTHRIVRFVIMWTNVENEWGKLWEVRVKPSIGKQRQGREGLCWKKKWRENWVTIKEGEGKRAINELRMILGGQPKLCFFYKRIRKKQFFTQPVVNNNKIVRSMSDGVERKSGLICLVRCIQSCWCRRVLQFLVTLDNG